MARHHERRAPRKNNGFSWGRVPLRGCVDYRLFRRDHTGALHMIRHAFDHRASRSEIAAAINAARHQLRDQVDTIDLRAWGIAA